MDEEAIEERLIDNAEKIRAFVLEHTEGPRDASMALALAHAVIAVENRKPGIPPSEIERVVLSTSKHMVDLAIHLGIVQGDDMSRQTQDDQVARQAAQQIAYNAEQEKKRAVDTPKRKPRARKETDYRGADCD